MRMVSCDLKALCYVNVMYMKKNMHKTLVFNRGFPQIPIARSGILKIPSGSTPCPRASAPASVRRFAPHSGLRYGPRARRATLEDFQNLLRA